MFYDYEYFCGANVFVSVDGAPILEVAGISYAENESMRPIYGYASRYFDAMARGQVLVQGHLAVNFVHPDYLYRALAEGKAAVARYPGEIKSRLEPTQVTDDDIQQLLLQNTESLTITEEVQTALEKRFWGSDEDQVPQAFGSPTDAGPFNLTIRFSELYEIRVYTCFLTGRGQTIQIDENVLVEEYPFLGRLTTTRRVPQIQVARPAEGP